jgi:hypothetical protein
MRDKRWPFPFFTIWSGQVFSLPGSRRSGGVRSHSLSGRAI